MIWNVVSGSGRIRNFFSDLKLFINLELINGSGICPDPPQVLLILILDNILTFNVSGFSVLPFSRCVVDGRAAIVKFGKENRIDFQNVVGTVCLSAQPRHIIPSVGLRLNRFY